jgi:murein DD-endopeptidase MepM/ murein hydrolase activator NlpD
MPRINYYFDTELSQYKRAHTHFGDLLINAAGMILVSTAMAIVIMIVYSFYFESPRELRLSHEVNEMEINYSELSKRVESFEAVLTSIEGRDDNIYRVVFGAEPTELRARLGDANLRNENSSLNKSITSLTEKISTFRRKLYIESLSQDEIIRLAINKERMYAAIPAIQPISNKQLVAIASGFGMRIHPVYKVIRMHNGIDFAAPTGTFVYATADGQVLAVDEKFDSYGKMITIDHGFGYTTRYGHLQDFVVRTGQHVKRGEQIGFVGNTGLSTASHLHYEILINGLRVDPVHYFFDDLTPVEYEKVLELASIKNQSLGN